MSRFGAPIAVVLALVLAVPGLLVVASWQQQNTSCPTTSTGTGADTRCRCLLVLPARS